MTPTDALVIVIAMAMLAVLGLWFWGITDGQK